MPYDATDYITASLNGEDLKSQYSPWASEEFKPLPEFKPSRTSNDYWLNVTTTRIDPDGSTTQSFQIISKQLGV
ncbi:MAG TPA: hypothetical protein VIQ31_28965 [Phormidium sp.]